MMWYFCETIFKVLFVVGDSRGEVGDLGDEIINGVLVDV